MHRHPDDVIGQIGDVILWCLDMQESMRDQYRWCSHKKNHHIRIHPLEKPSKVPNMWFEVRVSSTEVTDLRWPCRVERWCAQPTRTMCGPQQHQIFAFVSITSRIFAMKHCFIRKSAGGCTTYDVIAPWPDLTRSFFFFKKCAQDAPLAMINLILILRAV